MMLEQGAPKPDYPYIGYKFTSPYSPEVGLPIADDETVPSTDPDFEHDIEQTLVTMPTMTVSISAYSNDIDSCRSTALRAREWLFHVGYDELADQDIVVESLTEVGDRTVLLEILYEYRAGFDCTLRVTDTSTLKLPTIEVIEFERK